MYNAENNIMIYVMYDLMLSLLLTITFVKWYILW